MWNRIGISSLGKALVSLILPLALLGQTVSAKEPVDYVNPYIGNISHLLVPTYSTVQLPNSMLRFYPSRQDYTDDLLHGFTLIVPKHRRGGAFQPTAAK
jgi:hypothetical protein